MGCKLPRIGVALAVSAFFGAAGTGSAVIISTQYFDNAYWSRTPGALGNWVNTNSPCAWTGLHCKVGYGVTLTAPYSAGNCFGLGPTALGGTNGYLITSLMTNGVGYVSFYMKRRNTTGSNVVEVQVCTNGGSVWEPYQAFVADNSSAWTYTQAVLTVYEPCYLRFYKTTDDGSANQAFCIDDVQVHFPPARVVVTNAMPQPNPVLDGDPISILAEVYPVGVGLVSNIVVTNFWRAGGSGPYEAIGMISNAPNQWITSTPIPATNAGIMIQYQVRAYFQGPDAMSPTNFPLGGLTNLQFTVRGRPYTSDYRPTSMSVTGALSTNMMLITNSLWQAFAETALTLTNATVNFYGATTNIPSTTNSWGDNGQTDSVFLIEDTAAVGEAGITIGGTNTGQFSLTFHDTSLAYTIDHGAFHRFDDWAVDELTNDDWIITDGIVSYETERVHQNQSCVLATTRSASVRSCYLTNGVGAINFWYRNYQSNGVPIAYCRVQQSITGSTNAEDWVTVTNINGFSNSNYARFAMTVENRGYRYVRLLNPSNVAICVDDVLVTDPYYAGVILRNLTNTPVAPTPIESAEVSVDVAPVCGASNRVATLRYRGGTVGPFKTIAMTNTTGNLFTTVSNIPAGSGTNGGAGIVQYYVDVTFDGFQSTWTSPTLTPPGGSNAPASYLIQAAYVIVSNVTLAPNPPLAGSNITVSSYILPFAAASSITARTYYRYGATGAFTNFMTMSDQGGNLYATVPPVPSNTVPGVPFQHFIRAWFSGPSANSPTDYPPGGVSAPLVAVLRTPPLLSSYTNMALSGGLSTGLMQTADYQWEGVISSSTNLVNPSFLFAGFNATTSYWGDSDQNVWRVPLFGSAADADGSNITVSGTNSGHLLLRFLETNKAYTVQRCAYMNFDDWSGTTSFGTYTNSEGWVVTNARTTTASAPDQARVYRGKSGVLNDDGATAMVLSPYLTNGIGEISFRYRNWESNGATEGGFTVDLAPDLTGPWTNVATVTNLFAVDYLYYYRAASDRDNHYVRIVNTPNGSHPALCLDEIVIAEPAAAVLFTNLLHAPVSPTPTNAVQVSVEITSLAEASNLNATLYYRSGTTGVFKAIAMTNAGSLFTTVSNIPERTGPLGGAGTVQYYVQCGFEGYQGSLYSPMFSPRNGSNAPSSYTIQSAYVIPTNLTISPDPPLAGSNTHVYVDALPMAAASNLSLTAYYRFGGSGTVTNPVAMSLVSGTLYKTTGSGIPVQTNPGALLTYYVRVDFVGPNAMTPTNCPVTGYITNQYRPPTFRSACSNAAVTGTLVTNLRQTADYTWQGVAYSATNLIDPGVRFQTIVAATNTWGDSDPAAPALPVYGTATELDGPPAVLHGTNSAGYFVFRFNETNSAYSIQRCVYETFDAWSEPDYTNRTNSAGWTIVNARTTTNGYSSDPERTFLGQGRSAVLDDDTPVGYVQSPFLSNGIGEVTFWYRNWESNGLTPGGFTVEKAVTNAGPWTRVTGVTNVLTRDYVYCTVSLSDRDNFWIRIANTTNSGRPRFLLDEVIIAEPAAGVSFTNLAHSPLAPSILHCVTVTVEIASLAGASNLVPRAWYRIGTNGIFDSVAMTNVSGNLYATSNYIPRGQSGPMQYYVTCSYAGFLSEFTSPAYYPAGGSNDTRTYTNTDSVRVQPFDAFQTVTGFADTNFPDGWRGSSVRVANRFALTPMSQSNTCWLNSYVNSQNSWVMSPLLSNGIGSIHVGYRNKSPIGGPTGDDPAWSSFDIELGVVSTNSTNWYTLTNVLCDQTGVWEVVSHPLLRFDGSGVVVRIIKTGDDGYAQQYLALDNIFITYPPALTAISNVMVHPGYPSSNEEVFVSCDIYDMNTLFPSFGSQAWILYRKQPLVNYSQPIAMTRTGDHAYRTVTGIPRQARDSVIEFFITNSFKGYSYTLTNFLTNAESLTPIFYPPGGGENPTNYTVRQFGSDYAAVNMMVNSNELAMRQLSDNSWQGIINLTQPTNRLAVALLGYSNYNGSAYLVDEVQSWGDSTNWKTYLPLYSSVQEGGSNLYAYGSFLGQYMLRFDESNLVYTLQQCVWQDFETWGVTSNFVSSANDNSIPLTINFNSRTASVAQTPSELFTNWSWPFTNVTEAFEGWEGWGILQSRRYFAGGSRGYVCLTTNSPQDGAVVRPNVWDPFYGSFRGIGTLKFDYRSFSTNPPASITVWLVKTNNPYAYRNTDFRDADWIQWGSTITNLTNSADVGWRTSTNVINTSTTYAVVILHEDGGSVLIDNLSLSEWYAETTTSNGWTVSEGWITPSLARSGLCCEFDERRANINTEMYLMTPRLTNGVSFFEFWFRSKTTNTLSFAVQVAPQYDPTNWVTVRALTNVSANVWTFFTHTIMTNETVYVRVKNTTKAPGILLIDDVMATKIAIADSWASNNGRCDTDDPQRRFIERSYFLNDSTNNIGTPVFLDQPPYLETPGLTNGIGEISFWYRNWAVAGPPNAARFAVQKSLTGGTNANEWLTITNVTDVRNISDYEYFRLSIYDPTCRYVRIVNQTNSPAYRLCLDDVLVTAPIMTDIGMSNLMLTPSVPLFSNNVKLSVVLYDPFLGPSNIHVYAVYATATNYGGTGWNTTNTLPMTLASSNPAGRWYRYETLPGSPIPSNAIDTYVSYWALCYFDGMHSDRTSPKTCRQFQTPSWYRPVDYGTNIPWYVVYSCPPGAVWINEFNTIDYGADWYWTNEFVELTGPAGVNIGKWALELVDVNYNGLTTNTLPPGSVLTGSSGAGYWVFGDAGVANVNTILTNAPPDPDNYPDGQLPNPGGLVLRRSMGAIEYALSYDCPPNTNYTSVGADNYDIASSVQLQGTGTNYSHFTWDQPFDGWSAGVLNDNQIIIAETTIVWHIWIPSVDAHGTILPSTNIAVEERSSTNFILTADEHWRIVDVLTNGGSIGQSIGSNYYCFTMENILTSGTVHGVILPNTYTFQVLSGHGAPSPVAGLYTNDYGTVLTNWLYGSPQENSGTQFLGAGWALVGNVDQNTNSAGSGTNVVLTLTNDSVLTWVWATNYLFGASGDNGSIGGSTNGWVAAGSSVTVTGLPNPHYTVLLGWTGDVAPQATNNAVFAIPALDRPRAIVVHFGPDPHTLTILSDHGTPNPLAGVYTNSYGTSLTNWLYDPIQQNGGTQFAHIGWALAGNVDRNTNSSGAGTNVVLTITNNAMLTWTWVTNYQFAASANNGSIGGSTNGWYAAGSGLTVTGVPSAHYGTFAGWSGDVTGLATDATVLVIAALDRARTVLASFLLDKHTLTILSGHGAPSPTTGVYTNDYGTTLTNTLAGTPDALGRTQYVGAGWALAGNVDQNTNSSGAGTNVVLVLTNNSWLTWVWDTNYQFYATADPNGAVEGGTNTTGWYLLGSSVTVTGLPASYYHFEAWTGEVAGLPSGTSPLVVTMSLPRAIVATFDLTLAASNTPHIWMAQYGITTDFNVAETNDPDRDGHLTWQEYVTGTDPTDRWSSLRFVVDRADSGTNLVRWIGGTNGVQTPYGIWVSTNLGLPGTWVLTGTQSRLQGTNTWTNLFPSSGRLFYRISATN